MIPPPTLAVLAGGLATRLGELTRDIPKSLVDVHGRPFLAWQLELFAAGGVTDVVLCIGHHGRQIEEWIAEHCPTGMRVRFSRDGDRQLGTGGAIRNALPLLGDAFLVTYGDSYLPCDYVSVYQEFLRLREHPRDGRRPLGLMIVYENGDQFDQSNVLFRDRQIVRYDKLHRTSEMRHIDWGLSALTPEVFADFPRNQPLDLARVFSVLLEAGELAGLEMRERFYEVGSSAGLREFSDLVAERRLPSAATFG